jgi:O-antigen ligase
MKALRGGIFALITFSVLAHGTVEVWSESLLEIGAVVLLALWASVILKNPEVKIRWSPLNWPVLGFLLIGLGQLAFHETAYAFLTRSELLKMTAYFIVFFLVAQAFRERADLMKVAWFLILLGFVISLFGITQAFTSSGEIYWFRKLTLGGDPFGPYVNRNHFAGFVELVVPVGLALVVFRGLRNDLFPMAMLLTIVPIGALILSGSRGGIVSFAFEACVLALIVRRRKARAGAGIGAVGTVVLAAIALIAWMGAGKAIERFSKLRPGDVSLGRRGTMFRGAARVFFDHPIAGSGVGTLVTVFPEFDTSYDGKVVDHVHNDYIETLAETGVLGGLCGLAFLLILFREAQKNFAAEQGHFSRALHAGAITALSGLLLHSFVDFNLRIPSNVLLFLLQAYLATSPPLPSEAPASSRGHRRHTSVVSTEVAI